MRFEQLLQIYWSRYFLYGGKTYPFQLTFKEFFDNFSGLSKYSKFKFIKRFEFNFYIKNKKSINFTLDKLNNNKRYFINIFLSKLISINNNINEFIKYNMIRLYLIKSYRGKANLLGKPSRGQRTWSNAWNSHKCNRIVLLFINEVKRNNPILKKSEKKDKFKFNYNKKKLKRLKKNVIKIKLQTVVKQKKNLWF